ncbi:hypothetical protein GCM10028857_21440 [Salinarchaeum chitinilyticum]
MVTPAYNEATRGFLSETLSSVSQQEYERIEHVVVDDGSTDETPQLVREFDHDHELRLVRQENRGMTRAVNRGLEETDGDIVVWLNADDVLPRRDAISRVVSTFQRKPETDFVYGSHAFLGPEGTVKQVKVPYPWPTHKRLLLSNFAIIVFADGDTFRSLGLNDEYRHVSDRELYLRGASHGATFTYVPDLLYGHREHEERKTEQVSDEMAAESKQILEKYGAGDIRHYDQQVRLLELQLDALQLLGLRRLLELHRHPEEFVDAIGLDSLRSAVTRQLRTCVPG